MALTALSPIPSAPISHRVYDWVVIYEGADGTGQATVVTERRGALTGERVVRGREPECARYHRGELLPPAMATTPAEGASRP